MASSASTRASSPRRRRRNDPEVQRVHLLETRTRGQARGVGQVRPAIGGQRPIPAGGCRGWDNPARRHAKVIRLQRVEPHRAGAGTLEVYCEIRGLTVEHSIDAGCPEDAESIMEMHLREHREMQMGEA